MNKLFVPYIIKVADGVILEVFFERKKIETKAKQKDINYKESLA